MASDWPRTFLLPGCFCLASNLQSTGHVTHHNIIQVQIVCASHDPTYSQQGLETQVEDEVVDKLLQHIPLFTGYEPE